MKKLFLFLIFTGLISHVYGAGPNDKSLDQILAGIEELEGNRDPKCYASASRLEDFMYGTPLTDPARYQKNKLQKRLAEIVWRDAAVDGSDITVKSIDKAFTEIIRFKESPTEATG